MYRKAFYIICIIYIYCIILYVYIGARLQFHPRESWSMHENTVFSHTKCLSRNIQSWIFFLIFFFGIKLPNRVPLNHPINEAATKTLTFSVILFELPSEHCACGHEFIGFAEPMWHPWQLACLRPTPLQFLQQAALHLKTPAPNHHLPWCHDGKQDAIVQSHVQCPRQPRPNKADPLLRRLLTARTQHTACTDARWSQTVLQAQSPPTTAATHPLVPCSAHRKRNDQNDPEWHRRHESCPEKTTWAKRACHDD